jgi:hypothetical protein
VTVRRVGTDRARNAVRPEWGIESRTPRAVVDSMTVSDEIAPDVAALDGLTPRRAPDEAPRPAALAARVREGVARVRGALADGSLHHHPPRAIPAGHPSHAIDVVRAWAAGAGPGAQRRLCGVCSPRSSARR